MTTVKPNLKKNSRRLDISSKAIHASHYHLVAKMIKIRVKRKTIKSCMLLVKMIRSKSYWRILASRLTMIWVSSQVSMPFNTLGNWNPHIRRAALIKTGNWKKDQRKWNNSCSQKTKKSLILCLTSWGSILSLEWLPSNA